MFKQIDIDGDNKVSLIEILQYYEKKNVYLNKKYIQAFIDVDGDNDGKISR